MNILYGIELELFYLKNDKITIPKDLPIDGCGAIVEFRSMPYSNIYSATFEVHQLLKESKDNNQNLIPHSLNNNRHKFTNEEWREACKQSEKDYSITPKNIYGKKSRVLPRSVVAVSLQLNFSNLLAKEYVTPERIYPPRYGMLDNNFLIKHLDIEFAKEIKEAKRIPGEYAIKDNGIRLEYRSLPATTFFVPNLELRILKIINLMKDQGE